MKNKLTAILLFSGGYIYAQDNQVKLQDLAAPTSPAFILTDVSPTLVQSPATPRSFVLGVAQSYQQSGGFPNNYAADFTPYWWIKPYQTSIYDLQGIKVARDANGKVTGLGNENPFSGLKFTSISIAFLNKDMIPDSTTTTQKIFSIGARSTIVKVHRKDYVDGLKAAIKKWHTAALNEMRSNPAYMAALARANSQAEMDEIAKKYKPINVSTELDTVNALLAQKPVFAWDIAGAYAVYGINDQQWKSGRSAIWTTISTYLPLQLGNSNVTNNYFSLSVVARYQNDNYYLNDDGTIGANNSFDIGGQATLIFNQLSIGVESLYRYNNGKANNQNRTIGVINYKLSDNLYINASFGKNFTITDKLVSTLGINWGFGKESATLPDTP